MTLHGHILCWNESRILPFTLDYWKRAGVDKLFVYDNGSTDGSLEILSRYDWVEVIPFDSNGKTDEFVLTNMRNTMWKRSKGYADWVIVADCDEVPFCKDGNLKDFLAKEQAKGVTVIKTNMYNIVTDEFPEYKEGTLMHQGEGVLLHSDGERYRKTLTFRPDSINEMNWVLGAHSCFPTGHARIDELPDEYLFFHFRHCGVQYMLEKSKRLYDNLREDIKRGGGIDWHYKAMLDDYDSIRKKVLETAFKPEEIGL